MPTIGPIPRVLSDPSPDARTLHVRTAHTGNDFHPFTNVRAWQARCVALREQILVAAGLWPLPQRCPLRPVIHGRIDRGSYTIEKVFFASFPDFYVSGNLYRPTSQPGPFPGIISPHGHWHNLEDESGNNTRDGRFLRFPDDRVAKTIADGYEKNPACARSPLQARCANLARLGCVVFHYDMIGYADANVPGFRHAGNFTDIRAHLFGLSLLGLHLWNSMRALDFVLSLPEVDPNRICCTGASGGATQTFMMMVTDPRLNVAAPVCMISAGEHQGTCWCENAPLVRQFTDNVELAATFAPKPLIHPSATGDWTTEFPKKGFPEIRATYALLGAADAVENPHYQAPHNYNLKSREAVYNFLNTHLHLGHPAPVSDQSFEYTEPKDLSVYDAAHPRPQNALDAAGMQKFWESTTTQQIQALRPTDTTSWEKFRIVLRIALQQMTGTSWPAANAIVSELPSSGTPDAGRLSEAKSRPVGSQGGGRTSTTVEKLVLSRKNELGQVPAVVYVPSRSSGKSVVLVHPNGKSACAPELIDALLAGGHTVLLPDLFLQGEMNHPAAAFTQPHPDPEAYVTAYNRMTLANRVHDLLTAAAYLRTRPGIQRVDLAGTGRAGVWCLLAAGIAGDALGRTVADADQFDFDQLTSDYDPDYLPCALRYGGLGPLAALAAPSPLWVAAATPTVAAWLQDIYRAAGAAQNLQLPPRFNVNLMVDWLLK